MSEKDLRQEAQVIVEEDKDYDELLKTFENPIETTKPKKKNKALKWIIPLFVFVALAGAFATMLLIPSANDETEANGVASVTAETDAEKTWQATVEADESGNIKENGTGTLVEYLPAEISTMQVENSFGIYTVKSKTPTSTTTDAETGEETTSTETTEYTLVGFEDFALQSGNPDALASDCSAVNFNKIISADASKNLADYGLDKPQSVVTVTYTDGSKAVIKVGKNALQSMGTYISFGDSNAVYLVSSESVDTFLKNAESMISLSINKTATDSESSKFEDVVITGKAYGEKITLIYNDYPENVTNAYIMTTPEYTYADDTEASNITGTLRGIMATEVVCLNPTSKDLKKYGLGDNYAHIVAKYPDITVNLHGSKPDDEGNCYIMVNGGNIIYKIASTSVPWVETSVEALASDYVLSANLQGLESVMVTTDKDYRFTTTTTKSTTTDDNGEEVETENTVVTYGDYEFTIGYFETFFDNMALLVKADTEKATASGKADLTITYDYSGDKKTDVVKFYKGENNRHVVTVNGKAVGHVYSSYVEKLTEQTTAVIEGKEINSFW